MVLIGNPAAGLRRRPDLFPQLVAALGAQQIRAEVHGTTGPGDASAAAARAAASGEFDAVLAVGGDGTVHEVVNGLAGTRVPFAVAPSGTMNILARHLRLPLDPVASVRGLRDFRPFPFTAGHLGGRHFLLMAGVGFDAYALGLALRRAGPRKLTMTRYTLAALAAAVRFTYRRLAVLADGERFEGTSAIVGNVPRYGGNLLITPRADPLDPFLDLCLLTAEGMRAYSGVFRSVVLGGRHVARRDVVYRKVRRLEVRLAGNDPSRSPDPNRPEGRPSEGIMVQLDGELLVPAPEGPLVMEARPGAVLVLAPAAWRAAAVNCPVA